MVIPLAQFGDQKVLKSNRLSLLHTGIQVAVGLPWCQHKSSYRLVSSPGSCSCSDSSSQDTCPAALQTFVELRTWFCCQPLLCYKIGTRQLPACNSKHTLLSFSVARCFFTFLVPQVFCGCELTYSDTRNSEFRGSLWTSGEAGLLWGLGRGTSSLSSLLRSQCLVSLHWEGAWVGGQNRSGWREDNRVSPKTGRNLRTTTA